MKRSSCAHASLVALAVGLALAAGCSSTKALGIPPTAGASGSGAGNTGDASTAGGAGALGTAGASGTAGAAGAGGAPAGATGENDAGPMDASDAGGDAGAASAAGSVDAGGAGGTVDVTKVAPTAGCGKDAPAVLVPGTLVQQTMQTMGVKDAMCADSKCGAWSFLREYYVRLPTGYDKTKAYPLVIEGPGCGGRGNNLYTIPGFDSTVIRVGLSPSADDQAFHATNPGQGCFDDKEGDDSIEWTFYENLHDLLASTVCFDRNRVFAAGNSSGAWVANELGCKYAGDAKHPIRGVMPNTGGLPTDAMYVPTCTQNPLAGMWSYESGDPGDGIDSNIVAINRALNVNGCTPKGVALSGAVFDNFPIGGANLDTTCKKISGCPDLAPLVVCSLPGSSHNSNDTVVDPGWPAFLKLFSTAPLLTP